MTNTCRILLVSLSLVSLVEALVSPIFFPTRSTSEAQSLPALNMAIRNRGLEVRRDGATPQEGGMTLYVKAGPDGTSVGDCPFAQYVRMVLHEKNLDYDLRPSTQETKPTWLIEHYGGKMPALRHRKECYTESEVIAQYLEFFFEEPTLTMTTKRLMNEANAAVEGFFPAVARYLKHTPDGDDQDAELKLSLEKTLQKLETHLSGDRVGPFLVGDGQVFSLADCSLAPKLYHMKVGLKAFKNNAIHIETDFPHVNNYMVAVFGRKSFIDSLYSEETVVWGWGNARN